jgi:hypothetical protein
VNDAPDRATVLLSASATVLSQHGSAFQPADKRSYDHIYTELAKQLTADQLRELAGTGESRDSTTLLRETMERFLAPLTASRHD